MHAHERYLGMAIVAQDALERRRHDALAAFEHLRKPLAVMYEHAGNIVAPVVGDGCDENVVEVIVDGSVQADTTEVGEASENHGSYPVRKWMCAGDRRRSLTLAESMLDSARAIL